MSTKYFDKNGPFVLHVANKFYLLVITQLLICAKSVALIFAQNFRLFSQAIFAKNMWKLFRDHKML
jgi:uncharacterized membrane protein